MGSLLDLYDMQTKFFKNVLDGISDKDTHNRLNTKANHIAWLAGSLVQQRFELAQMLGSELVQKADELFKNNKGIQDGVTYPSLQQYLNDWERISTVLKDLLLKATDEKLDSSMNMEGFSMTIYELITFIIYREANCIGQIALWRRLLNYEPMKYM